MSNTLIREILFDEVRKDLIGPHADEETFESTNHPKARYLSGVLWPIQTAMEEGGSTSVQTRETEQPSETEKPSINVGTKPSSMGLSCKIPITQKTVRVKISYARYVLDSDSEKTVETESNEKTETAKSDEKIETAKSVGTAEIEKTDETAEKETKQYPDWKRRGYEIDPFEINLGQIEDKKEIESNFFFRWRVRENRAEQTLTLSAFLTNEVKTPKDEFIQDYNCIFQPEMRLESPDSSKIFLNISTGSDKKISKLSPSEKLNLFLFRKIKHFAQGRNCSVEWNVKEKDDKTDWIQTTFLPHHIIPEIKPKEPSRELKEILSMKRLADVTNFKDYGNLLEPIISGYGEWISDLEKDWRVWKSDSEGRYFESKFISPKKDIPKERIDECTDALKRIMRGKEIIATDPLIGEAFRFTNEVMYENVSHSRWVKKNKEKITRGEKILEEGPNYDSEPPEWRLFQMAFLLLNIESITDPKSEDRKIADLLWFPTGGGKTEAYYGVIAFTLAYRRIRGMNPKTREEEFDRYGISILMRYTYRLLTLQQFQRAATLFCSLEYVRMRNSENRKKFGNLPFTVGLWVGHDTTPNSFDEAKEQIQLKIRNPSSELKKTDPMQLLNCPWCGRELNARNYEFEPKAKDQSPKRIRIRCGNKCFFGREGDEHSLPVVFVDEDIRNMCPSLLISTVDKFAQVSWNWKYSTFFGIVSQYCKRHGYRPGNAPSSDTKNRCNHKAEKILVNFSRNLAPPELIIQDELHLIAGPLGTLTGLYETAIDNLCTRNGIRPKIIASTATTKKSDEQMRDLFNVETTKIFPPQGFGFEESYFAKVLETSDEHPGKLHIGICSTSVSGASVDSRIAACILRKVRHIRENKDAFFFEDNSEKSLKEKTHVFSDKEIDPYYTLVSYHNTIKNLGAAMRTYEDTIPGFMEGIRNIIEKNFQNQNNAEGKETGILEKVELTGRIDASMIPNTLQRIETKIHDKEVLDALLCTNMLSVGVDVERLNVMVINGQPKSTSEYIQASGRIGRVDPGIVFTNYTYVRPRDLSYFENFLQFHSTYHKSVEPGTLTPFSSRARDRGLSSVFLALIRMNDQILSNNPKMFDSQNTKVSDLINEISKIISDRVKNIDPSEKAKTEEDLKDIIQKWNDACLKYPEWADGGKGDLKYRRNPFTNKTEPNVSYLINSSRDRYNDRAFVIPESLRDAESEISLYYSRKYEDMKQW